MHGLTVVCVCVYVCVCGWVVRFTCLQGGAVYILSSGEVTFTNCNFTSNEAKVSFEEAMCLMIGGLTLIHLRCMFLVVLFLVYFHTQIGCK